MAVGVKARTRLERVFGRAAGANIADTVDAAGNVQNDSVKMEFGTGQDATIYYDGTNLIIDTQEVGSGDLQILNGDVQILAPAASPGRLLLSTAELTVVDGDELGRIDFQAPSETGADAILVAASIYAEADDAFAATVNACELVFATAASETAAEKMRLTSTGQLGIGTAVPGAQLEVQGAVGLFGTLRLSTAETTNVDGDILGSIDFQALDAAGTDAILVAASIHAEVDDTFAADNNSCELVFNTAASETATEKMRLTSDGKLGIGPSGMPTPAATVHIDGDLAISNTTEGQTARLTVQTAQEVVTLTGATTDSSIAIPSGAVLLGVSFNVDVTVVDSAGDDTWSAAFITGSTTALATAAAAAIDTKVNTTIVPEVASDVTEVRFTPNAGNFSSGAIELVAYYYTFTGLANVAV